MRTTRLLPWLAPIALVAIELPVLWTVPHVGEWFVFWYAGHLVANGASPYEPMNWLAATHGFGAIPQGVAVNTFDGWDLSRVRTDGRWLWPPLTGILLAPFGALPLGVGIPLMHLAWIAMALITAVVLVRTLVRPSLRPFALCIVVASPSLVQVMRASSATLLIFPGIALLFETIRRESGWRLGIAAGAIAVRAQLFALVALATLYDLVSRRRQRATAVAVAVFASIEIAAFAVSPVPLDPSLVDAARAFTLHDSVSTWRLAWDVAPDFVAPVALALITIAAVLAGIAIRRAGRSRSEVILASGLAFAVAVVPYAHMYDQLALVPAWLIALRGASVESRHGRVMLAAVLVSAVIYTWIGYIVGTLPGMRAAGALAPFMALALLAGEGPRTDA